MGNIKHARIRMPKHTIKEVVPGSIADELGVGPGDRLLTINAQQIADVMDYEQLCACTSLELCFEGDEGEYWADVEKDETEGLGLVFETPLMSAQRSCANTCVFCFIDQLPKGMRSSLYYKDDDWRLSLMTGNYITLTNVSDNEFNRMLRLQAGPLYISVHATDPKVRGFMLGQTGEAPVMERLLSLCGANIRFHMQIVACPGVNDAEVLNATIADLFTLRPCAQSVAVVPVGLTRFRDGLYPLRPFTRAEAAALIDQVAVWQKRSAAETGSAFVFIADEFYLKAGRSLPPATHYGDFAQLENGVGQIAWLREAFDEAYECLKGKPVRQRRLSIATGVLAAPIIKELAERVNADTAVYGIENRFFGPQITVAGLVTGQDIIGQLMGRDLGECLIIPECMLRSGESVFLDDVTLEQVQDALHIPVVPVAPEGLCAALWGEPTEEEV
ncbi:MAG: DUF512 domain-containing protein [Bacillota bacterium]